VAEAIVPAAERSRVQPTGFPFAFATIQ